MKEISCGTVPFTIKENRIYYLLIEGIPTGYVGFPKGHMEDGETQKITARRETLEETSITAKITGGFRKETHYRLSNGNEKTVVYFLCDFTGQVPAHCEGFEDFIYHVLPFDEAYEKLRFRSDKGILSAANKFIKENILNKKDN